MKQRIVNLLWFAYFAVLLCWGVNAYMEFDRIFSSGLMFAFYADGKPYVSDFANHYNAAMLAVQCFTDKSIDIYSLAMQSRSLESIISPVKPEQPFYMQYPPWFFVLISGLANLNLNNAWWCWNIIGMIGLLIGFFIAGKSRLKTPFAWAVALVALLSSYPCWASFRMGQTSLWLYPSLALFFWCLERKRSYLAGLAMAAALVKLQYSPFVIGVGILLGRLKFIAGVTSMLALLSLLAVWGVGLDNVMRFPQALIGHELGGGLKDSGVSGVAPHMMQNLRGEIFLFDPGFSNIAMQIGLIAGLCLTIYVWLKSKNFDYSAALTILLMLAFGPHTHTQDYVIACLALLYLWPLCSDKTHPAYIAGKSRIVMKILLLGFPALSWIFSLFHPVFAQFLIQPYLLWAISLITVSLFSLGRELQDKQSEKQ